MFVELSRRDHFIWSPTNHHLNQITLDLGVVIVPPQAGGEGYLDNIISVQKHYADIKSQDHIALLFS